MTESNLYIINQMIKASQDYPKEVIESSLIQYVCKNTNRVYEEEGFHLQPNAKLVEQFEKLNIPLSIELFIEFFEALLENGNVVENGIVFTPTYIAEYIISLALKEYNGDNSVSIIDPACGCGIFLISAIRYLHDKTGLSYQDIIETNIFGIDIDEDNVRRCKIILGLFLMLQGVDSKDVKANIRCADSLKENWDSIFTHSEFDYIIGNPPYVNTHDMNKETAKFLKAYFLTTRYGVYNIFYAFIERATMFLAKNGKIGYIVPNNFLTIKSAESLRQYIATRKLLETIVDFSDNMVFKPVRTYNCIIVLSHNNTSIQYCVLDKTEDIEKKLKELSFSTIRCDQLDKNGWKLVEESIQKNIKRIEGQFIGIKDCIKTGIATLKDDVYIVDSDENGFYKDVNGKRFLIDSVYVKKLYKIPDLKASANLEETCRYIIFPYRKGEKGFEIVKEQEFIIQAPNTYAYLTSRKEELDARDKGNPKVPVWYAYGRTQGLNKYGRKLLFPTFSQSPRFLLVNDELALFCNGYAVFENEYLELEVLQRILNSFVMQYYVKNTSYPIEGGYYCYQKKYIEKFTIPFLLEEEIETIKKLSDAELDQYLIKKYCLVI